jgi:hypothetical protein
MRAADKQKLRKDEMSVKRELQMSKTLTEANSCRLSVISQTVTGHCRCLPLINQTAGRNCNKLR